MPAKEKYNLSRSWYSPIEVAHMLGLKPRTIWGYLRQDSRRYPGRKVLVGEKVDTMWRIHREDLIQFFNEMYGD